MSKRRAFVRYSKQGKIVPGSLILTNGSYPNGPSTWKEVPVDLCCPTTLVIEPIGKSIDSRRAFIKYTKEGEIIPGSLIITNRNYPDSSATWLEVSTSICCEESGNNTTTTTTTTINNTTTTTTVNGTCCTPAVVWNSSGSGDGGSLLEFGYGTGIDCLVCSSIIIQYSTDNINFSNGPQIACQGNYFFDWGAVGIPFNSTYYVRVYIECDENGSIVSDFSQSIPVTAY